MSVTVRRNLSRNHAVKLAITTVVVFAVLGALTKWKRGGESSVPPERDHIVLDHSSPLLVPTIQLPVDKAAREAEWIRALAKAVRGNAEVTVAHGRVDVMTDQYAIEVDFLAKWKEGLGQAIHYADVSDRTPVLAIVLTAAPDEALLKQIERVTSSKGVRLVLLTPDMEEGSTRAWSATQ